jgi:tryptophan-rich sensory protein
VIVATIARFRRLDHTAAACLVPLAAWVAFASLLNFEIWRLNDRDAEPPPHAAHGRSATRIATG